MTTLRWARASGRHVAHVIWRDFARPSHGEFPASKNDREYVASCGEIVAARDVSEQHNDWKRCRDCTDNLYRMLE